VNLSRATAAALAILLIAGSASATDLNCKGPSNVEDFRYTWRMRGGLSVIAGLLFPTSGVGQLKTTYTGGPERALTSQLLITPSDGRGGFYVYESAMDQNGERTQMSYHGYAWKNKSRKEKTIFDWAKKIARIYKETPEKKWDKTSPLPQNEDLYDILGAIYFLRQNATTIRAPLTTTIYSDGKAYPVMMRPGERRTFKIEGREVSAIGFEIVDAPNSSGKKWPGGIRVWFSDDARRIPFRIEIQQSMASMQLQLESIESCAFMQLQAAAK
jgi:hypothetical protein